MLDVNTGKDLEDEVKWARFTSIAWVKDGSGFFYARYPEPKQGTESQVGVANHAIYFHAIDTPQAQDRLVYANPDQPNMLHTLSITEDGRYVAIGSSPVSIGNTLTVVDLKSADWKPRKLVDNLDDSWLLVGNVGTKFFLMTSQDAPCFKVVTMDIAAADPVIKDVVPEQDSVLLNASLVAGRLLISYLADVKTEVRRYTLDGKADGVVKLPGIGTAGGFKGDQDDPETFFTFTSFNAPDVIYRYDVASNTARVWAQPKVAIDLSQIAVEQRFYRSKDGIRVPMFIVRRKNVTRPAPTLLYAYGGYGIPLVSRFLAGSSGVGRTRRSVSDRQHSRRLRIWQGMARSGSSSEQAERLRRFHRSRRVSEGAGNHATRRLGDSGWIKWRTPDRRSGQSASRAGKHG